MAISQEITSKTGLRSFLIGDVRGYTRFTAEHGDEAAAHLAATFAGLAREAVEARGGRVIELRGDEVLAVFDVAAQSVRAARELQWTCAEEVARDPSLPLLVGIGIAAGEAVPVEEGYRGAALNLAARLCSTAAAGEVLVSAWLAELAGTIEGSTFSDRGEVQLKGFPQPVPFLEVSGTRDLPPPVAELDGPPPPLPPELDTGLPLIAREHEVRWARGTWRQARRGAGRVVFVSGPSGIGKTRLAAEIAAGVEASGGRVHYAGAGGTAIADTLAAIEDARTTTTPTLVILDDLDAAGDRAATELAQALDVIRHRPAFVLALAQRIDASASLAALVEVIDVLGDGHRALGPMDLDGVREICRVYAGDEVAEAPVETIARSSGGVPGRVHESMSEWAREEATRRLEAAAEWLTVGRERRTAGLGFANNVIGLKLDRLYRVPDDGAAEQAMCPYKGLASYGPGDAAFFFGREALVGELAARTVGVGLLGVMGASGSGKSSIVAAGLRSSLDAGLLPGSARWEQVSMRPGSHPMAELTSLLRTAAPGASTTTADAWVDTIGDRERLVLCVDQFEEIFTVCDDPDEVEAFVGMLTGLADHPDHVVVVAALRGDFYGHTAAHPVLAQMLNANHVLVGPMSAEELRRAIELPARRAGVHVESALVDRLVEEVGEAAGGLPLLSTALVELWEQREGGWLRLDAYERSGGLRGAVARLAEQTYGELDDAQREAAPSVFLRLVGPGEGEAVTRRRVPIDEFDTESDPAATEVLRRFTRDRLLTADDRTVEVAHEALLREWPRLRTWVAEDAQGRELRVHLTAAARVWRRDGKEDSELYRGARLSSAIDWAALHGRQLNELEREFLTASRQRSERETERQRRTNRRLRGLLAGVAVFLVFALVAGSIALVQRGRARTSAAAAQVSATQALAQSLGAKGFAQPQLSRALLLAHEGSNLAPSDDTEGSMLSTLLRAPEVLHTYTAAETERPLQVGPIDDGKILGVGLNSGNIDFYDVASGATLGVYDGSTRSNLVCCEPAPGGDAIAVIESTKQLVPEVIDPHTGTALRTFANDAYLSTQTEAGTLYSLDLAESRDGRWFYFGYSTGHPSGPTQPTFPTWIDRWDVASGRLVSHVAIGNGTILGLDLVRGDSTIAVTTGLGTTLMHAGSMRAVKTIPYRTSGVTGGTNANATITAVAGSQFGVVDFVNLRTGVVTHGLGSPMTQVQFVSFSPTDPDLAISTGDDGSVVRWDAGKGTVRAVMPIHASRIPDVTFMPDGSRLFTASLDGTATEIALSGPAGFGSQDQILDLGQTTVQDVLASGLSPVAAAGVDRSAYSLGDDFVSVVDAATGRIAHFAGAPAGSHIVSMSMAPDGHTLAVGAESPDYTSGTVWLFDVSATPRLVRRLPLNVSDRSVNVVTFADQGDEVIAGTGLIPLSGSIKGGYLVGWKTADGSVAFAPLRFPKNIIAQFSLSPTGALAAVGLYSGQDTTVQLLRLPTNQLLGTPTSVDSLSSLTFVADGSLATGDFNGNAQRWTVPDLKPSGKPILTGGGPVESVAPEPHAPYFLTTNFDGTTKIWSLATGQEVGTSLTPQDNAAIVASVTPDGGEVSIASQIGSVWTFPLSPQAWDEDACAVAGRNLTPTEWAQFVRGRPYEKVCPQYPLATP